MFHHSTFISSGFAGRRLLANLISQQVITMAGNSKLKIYGTLSCTSGKRMKTTNRVFFVNGQQAIDSGYRPCGHCMRQEYLQWRENIR